MGKVYLVGAGPGNPELITVRGMELIKDCDAILYDDLCGEKLLSYASAKTKKIYVGKRSGRHYKEQSQINNILVRMAKEYNRVVRLKGGDPYVFGRGAEEIQALAEHEIAWEVVPGVSSATAVPELAGIPVTHRGVSRSFHIITGHTKEGAGLCDYTTLANLSGTLVFLMGLEAIRKISKELIAHGMDGVTPAAVISCGGLPQQRIVRGKLKEIAKLSEQNKMTSPAIIVVGNTASYNLLDKGKKTVGVIATRRLYKKMERQLEAEGIQTRWICKMEVERKEDELRRLSNHLEQLHQYGWIIFVSQNAIRLFFEEVARKQIDYRKLAGVRFGVVGEASNEELSRYGFVADFVPSKSNIVSLANEFVTDIVRKEHGGKRVMVIHAVRGNDALVNTLRKNAIPYEDFKIYDVVGKTGEEPGDDKPDLLAFLSASGVDDYAKKEQFQLQVPIACIGDATAKELEKYHKKADLIAQQMDVEGLKEVILSYFNNERNEEGYG
ncbi:MAG: uroporphyrinogen-III C-methyltransferase [Eubacterium sp.]|nr:uroporphyrinogen-III C-methyltransferase [Eubacterium sp.]